MEVNTTNYKKYNTKNKLKQIMITRFQKKLINLLQDMSDEIKILDVGCGEGFISNYIYQNTNVKKITGIDINNESLTFAKNNNKNIEYIHKDIYDLDDMENRFDVVLLLEVLEHLDKPEKALKKLIKICKSKLIISVPNEPFFSLGNMLSFKNVSRLGNPVDHINRWSKYKFVQFLKKNDIHNFEVMTSFPWTIVIISSDSKE